MTPQTKEIIAKSLREYMELVEGKVLASRMYLGAFGLSLIRRFADLDSEHFITFMIAAYDMNRDKSFLIGDALRLAAVNEEQKKVRSRLYRDRDKALTLWLSKNYGNAK